MIPTFRASTVPIVISGVIAVAAALPVVSLGHVRLAPIPDAGFAIGWSSLAATPNALREQSVATLSGILLGLAVAALTVAATSVLALSVARAAARRSEVLVRRAVGATRSQLFTEGLVEGAVMAFAALAVGVPFGVAATRSALDAWPGSAAGGAGMAPIVTALGIAVVIICGSLFPMLTVRRYPRSRSPSAVPPELPVSAIQLGICLAILVAAAQLARRAGALMESPGATAGNGGEVFDLSLSSGPAQRAARYASLLEALGGSGVVSAPRAAELLIRPPANHGALAALTGHGAVVRRGAEARLVRDEAAPVAWFGRLVGLEGWVVLAIGLVGTFALMHLWVSALAPELAVRRAVGARRLRIIGFVLLRSVGIAVAGLAIGLWLGEMTSSSLARVLGALPSRDAAVVLRPAMALVGAALAGALVPAWRVTRASPALLLD